MKKEICIEIGGVDDCSELIADAMKKARAAQRGWLRSTLSTRRRLLRKLRHLIASQSSELASASASMRGRPPLESLTAEVIPLLEACRFLERNLAKVLVSKKLGWRGRSLWLTGTSSTVVREPYGVILIIGPGNYPLLLVGIQLLQAIAAGNAVLLKPAVGGTPAARALIALLKDAGFDKELCILLPDSVEAARTAIDQQPDKVVFTGSSRTGAQILAQLAKHTIPSTMELSGLDAVIIAKDADIELAAGAIAFGLTLNDGATCMAPRRAFVDASVADRFEERLIEKLQDRSHAITRIEPNIAVHGKADLLSELLRGRIKESIDNGARVIFGGATENQSLNLPLVLSGVTPRCKILQEDHFAPLLSIVRVDSETGIIEMVNDCAFGLGAGIFTQDITRAHDLASRIDAGVITINDLIIPSSDPRLPFGGRKRSGFGSTQGVEGLLEMTVPKVISVTRSKRRPAFEPTRKGDEELIAQFAKLTHQQGLHDRSSALLKLIRQLVRYRRKSTH